MMSMSIDWICLLSKQASKRSYGLALTAGVGEYAMLSYSITY